MTSSILPGAIAYGVLAGLMSFNLTLIVINWLSWRRYVRLNALLQDLCWRAWSNQHLPSWHAWTAITGIGFEIRPRVLREEADAE